MHCCSFFEFHKSKRLHNVTALFGPVFNLRLLSIESPVPPQREADRSGGVLEHRDGLVLPRAAKVDVVHS